MAPASSRLRPAAMPGPARTGLPGLSHRRLPRSRLPPRPPSRPGTARHTAAAAVARLNKIEHERRNNRSCHARGCGESRLTLLRLRPQWPRLHERLDCQPGCPSVSQAGVRVTVYGGMQGGGGHRYGHTYPLHGTPRVTGRHGYGLRYPLHGSPRETGGATGMASDTLCTAPPRRWGGHRYPSQGRQHTAVEEEGAGPCTLIIPAAVVPLPRSYCCSTLLSPQNGPWSMRSP